jgi:DNA-binding NarL/FixJ family response regulator
MHGIAATRAIREAHPSIAVLVVAMFDDDSVFAAMWAGTRGYLLKGADADEMVRAIRAIAHGEAIFSPSVAQQLMGFFSALRVSTSAV